jgi:hypothetical protein
MAETAPEQFASGITFGEAFPLPISGVYYMEDKVDELTR